LAMRTDLLYTDVYRALVIPRAKLEYPTYDVYLGYLLMIGKAYPAFSNEYLHAFINTVDVFADKEVVTANLMKLAESRYYSGAFGRNARGDAATVHGNSYRVWIDTGATTADLILDRAAATYAILGTEAVDLVDDRSYIIGCSCSGSTIQATRYSAWRHTGLGDRTVAVSATDTVFASGGFAAKTGTAGAPGEVSAGLYGWLKEPSSPAPRALAVIEVELEGSGSEGDPFKPLLSRDLVDVEKVPNVPDSLKLERRRYDLLRAKGFTEEEMRLVFGYTPQHQVDLNAVTWGSFELSLKSPVNVVFVQGDNPYKEGAVSRQVDFTVKKGFRAFKPPRDYVEAVELYRKLRGDFPYWLAGKDNFAYQVLGWWELDLFQNVDFYHGELLEHRTHYDQLKQVPDWEIRRRLGGLKSALSKVTALAEERDKHLKKLEEVEKKGW